MNTSEIKQGLRKLEFPACTKEALNKIGQLICGRAPNIKHMDLSLDLMAEFVFCEVDRRGNKRNSPFTAIQELQLLEVLFDFLNDMTSDSSRNSVFLTLFSGTTVNARLGVLSKLVSIAIASSSEKVLLSASTWMQQLGNTSVNSCKLAEALVHDYFVLLPNSSEKLRSLPQSSPQFVANFLTAVAELYYADNRKELLFPPQRLLETIVLWVSDNYKLCIVSQTMPSHLPPGAIAMEATTPIAGLMRWCILAPLYEREDELYAILHVSLLSSVLEIPSANPPRAISAQHLCLPMGQIVRYIVELQKQARNSGRMTNRHDLLQDDTILQLVLDRYAQAVQVTLSSKCVYGKINDLINQLFQLPPNQLLNIVMETHLQNKPPNF